MIDTGILPDAYTYTVLIRMLCKRDVEVQKTIAMLRRQSARTGREADDIALLESENNVERALDLFHAAVTDQRIQELDVEVFNQLLRVLSHYSNAGDARFVYDQLVRSPNAQPNSATFAALINLMGRARDMSSALQFFDQYTRLKTHMSSHDASYVYNALVDAYLKCHQLENAFRVVEHDMIKDGIKVTIIPYNSIIRYYCANGDVDQARALVERLAASKDNNNPAVDASSYGPILSAYCQADQWTPAAQMYDALLTTDISKAYGNLANFALLCLAHQQLEKALSVVRDMQDAGLEPDAILSERIVLAFCDAGDMDQALCALQTVLHATSPRALAKGASHLMHAALRIVTLLPSSDVRRLAQTYRVVTTAFEKYTDLIREQQEMLAKTLIKAYLESKRNRLSEADGNTIYEAALLVYGSSRVSDEVLPNFCDLVKHVSGSMRTAPPKHIGKMVLARLQQEDPMAAATWKTVSEQEAETILSPEAHAVSEQILKVALSGQFDEVLEMLQRRIVQQGLVPSPEIMRDVISLMGKQGSVEKADRVYQASLDAFQNLDEPQRSRAVYLVTNSILISYAQQGDMIKAKMHYDHIKAMGYFPDGNAYASLLLGSAQSATDEATDALTIYDEAKRHHVKPTTFFYNVVISKLAKARKLEPALYLFYEMQKLFKIIPNSVTYGAMISACVRAGSESHARRIFGEMLSSPSCKPPRVGPFNNMMQFYIRHQQPNRERVLEYFAELRRQRVKPSAHTYKLLMEAYACIAPYDMLAAHRMLTEMERRDKIRPQATHYATLIYAYGTLHRDVESAERVFAEMKKAGILPDEEVYQAMLDTLISNDRLERAERLYRDMLKTIIHRSFSPYIENLFIRGYGQKGMIDKAKAVFDAMSDDRLLLRHRHAGSGKDFVVVREPSTYEAMVAAYLENDMRSEAKQVFERMVQRGFPEKVVTAVAELFP